MVNNNDIYNYFPLILLTILFSCAKVKDVKVGYQDKMSYNQSDTVSFYVNSNHVSSSQLPLFNLNDECVKKVTLSLFPQKSNKKSWSNGFGYRLSGIMNADSLSSGIYYLENCSPFIVKNDGIKAKILVVYPSNTVNAYNREGGRSSYTDPRGTILSFNRPAKLQKYCLPFLKWIAKQNFKVDYVADIDLDDYTNLSGYKTIIIPGHSEYWTRKARRNFDKYVNEGGNAIILSGNTMWWQVRYEKDKMIITKDALKDAHAPDSLKTILWNDTSLHYPILNSIGSDFNHGGYGLKKDKGWNGYLIVKDSPLYQNTNIFVGDTLLFETAEHDGAPVKFNYGKPVIDTTKLNFYKQVLLGYDKTYRLRNTYATFIAFKKTKSSGTIINVGSTNWCSSGFTGRDSSKIKKLTFNFIDYLVNDKSVF